MNNKALVNVHLAVATLTVAWHYVLRVDGHDEAAGLNELAVEGEAHLRESIRGDQD